LAAVFLTTSGTSLLAFLMLPWGCMPRATRQSSQFHTFNREMYRTDYVVFALLIAELRIDTLLAVLWTRNRMFLAFRELPDRQSSQFHTFSQRDVGTDYVEFALLIAVLHIEIHYY
jgi:hypothetical protein